MAKTNKIKPIKKNLKNWLVAHNGNNHNPYLLRRAGLGICALIIIGSQLAGNFAKTHELKVLGYATDVSSSEVVDLTNQQRASAGLQPLQANPALNVAAATKAHDMFSNNYWEHVSPAGVEPWHWFDQAGYSYSYAGENLARDFNTSAGVVNGWMASQGHKENILNPNFSDIGIASVNGKLLGQDTTLVVAMYGAPSSIATTSGLPNASQDQPTLSLKVGGQTLASYTQRPTNYGLSKPLQIVGTVNFEKLIAVLVLGTVLLVIIMRHTVVWRRSKKNRRDVWFRTKPFLQAGLLVVAILLVLAGSFGAVL